MPPGQRRMQGPDIHLGERPPKEMGKYQVTKGMGNYHIILPGKHPEQPVPPTCLKTRGHKHHPAYAIERSTNRSTSGGTGTPKKSPWRGSRALSKADPSRCHLPKYPFKSVTRMKLPGTWPHTGTGPLLPPANPMTM